MLKCLVVCDERACDVRIANTKTVGYLREKIKEQMGYTFTARHLQLFLARKGGNWLQSIDPDVQQLKRGKIPDAIKAVMDTNGAMKYQSLVCDAAFGFPIATSANDDEFDVLVVTSDQVRGILRYDRKLSCSISTCCFCF